MRRQGAILFLTILCVVLLLVLGGCDFLPGPPGYNDMDNPLDMYEAGDETPPGNPPGTTVAWDYLDVGRVNLSWLPPDMAGQVRNDFAGVEISWAPPTSQNQPMRFNAMMSPINLVMFNREQGYTFTFRSFDFNDNLSDGTSVNLMTFSSTAPDVVNLTAQSTWPNQITASWSYPSGYTPNIVTVTWNPNPAGSAVAIDIAAGNATITGLQPQTAYAVTVTTSFNGAVSKGVTANATTTEELVNLRAGLVGEWLLPNGDRSDTSGNNYTAQALGVWEWAPDRFGATNCALRFPTGAGTLSAGSGALPTGTANRTMSVWVKLLTNPGATATVMSYGDVSIVIDPMRAPGAVVNGATFYSSSTRLSLNVWYNLVLIINNNSVTIVVNANGGETANCNPNTPSGTNLVMGSNLMGAVDDIRVYSRVLSPLEVEALHREQGYFDIASDFTGSTNTGDWVLGYLNVDNSFSPFNVYQESSSYFGNPTWSYYGDGSPPSIWRNASTMPILGALPGDVVLNPFDDGAGTVQRTVIRWTAPKNYNQCNINALFGMGDTGQVDVSVAHNGVVIPLSVGDEIGADFSFTDSRVIQAGDTLDFIVGCGDAYMMDSTPVSVTLSGN